MISKGTTPTITFTFDEEGLDLTQAWYVCVTFQNGIINLERSGEPLTVSEKSVSVRLSQQDTLLLAGNTLAQVNWVYSDGTRAASEIVPIEIGENLVERVIPE